MAAKQTYDASNILTKEGLDGVRAASGMYVGDGPLAQEHMVKECLDNSIDEFSVDRNDRIHVVIDLREEQPVFAVIDGGVGIPTEKLEATVSKLHTSGKFKGAGGYSASTGTSGTHGVGLKVVNALSTYFSVTSTFAGNETELVYAAGKLVATYQHSEDETEPENADYIPDDLFNCYGTMIVFEPDYAVLCNGQIIDPNLERMLELFESVALFNPGLRVTATVYWPEDERDDYDYFNDGTVAAYTSARLDRFGVESKYEPFSYHSKTLSCSFAPVNVHLDELFCGYVNSSLTSNASSLQIVGFRAALAKALQPYLTAKQKFTPSQVTTGLVGYVNAQIAYPKFVGQTKEKLVTIDSDKVVREELTPVLEAFFAENKAFAKTLIANACAAANAADSVRDLSKAKSTFKERKAKNHASTKLERCSARNAEDIEMFLVEGDSAGSGALHASDRTYQEVMPMRGKFLNAMQHTPSKLVASVIVSDLILALSDTIENFEKGKLRVGKIFIAADPDADGYHIVNLFHSFLFTFYPNVYAEGRVYVVQTPLFRGVYKDHTFYGDTYEEVEAQMDKKKLPKAGRICTRFKGLGEMESHVLHHTVFNPETRRVVRVEQPSMDGASTFRLLMGKDPSLRKKLLGLDSNDVEVGFCGDVDC